jgi:hypothetical protein
VSVGWFMLSDWSKRQHLYCQCFPKRAVAYWLGYRELVSISSPVDTTNHLVYTEDHA